MGTRIHKSLGWGLNDVQVNEKDKLNDPRFIDTDDDYEDIFEKNMQDFLDWILNNKEETTKIIESALPARKNLHHQLGIEIRYAIDRKWKEKRKFNYSDWSMGYEFNPEFGLKNVINFIPIEFPEWGRSDDAIDYYEVANFNMKPSVKMLDTFCGIYPYTGAIRCPNKPKVADLSDYLDPRDWAMLRGTYSSNPSLAGNDIAKQVTESYRPVIPDSVMLYTYWLGLWKDWKTTVQELRPMIYTYWG